MTASAHATTAAPAVAVFVKFDTLGDLVLLAPTLRAIRERWSATRLVVVIRRAYADLAPVLVDGVEWLTTTLDPFARGPREDSAEFSRLRDIMAALQPDLVVAATSRRNWAEIALAATSGATRRLALGAGIDDEFFATQVRVDLGISAANAFTATVATADDEPDWRRNFRLADALLGSQVPRTPPSLPSDGDISPDVSSFLQEHHLAPGGYAVCAAAGFSNVGLKTWPADRFAAVVRHLRAQHGIRTVLIGHDSERDHLAAVAAASSTDAVCWLGRDGNLRELVQVVRGASLLIGNDTGASHLAAALNVPVVVVYGGGTWPRFVPAGRRTIGVVQPLPCFGCDWDCAFGDAPCIKGITVDDVVAAVDFAMANRTRDFAEIRRVEHLAPETRSVVDQAAARHREFRRAHLARQHKLEELTALDREKDTAIEEKEGEIAALKAVCNEREQAIFTLNGHVRNLQTQVGILEADKALLEKTMRALPPDKAEAARALADQAVHIRNIESLLMLREQELGELRASAANRAAGRHDLEQAKHYGRLLAEKEAVIRALRAACEERESVIRRLSAEATTITAKARKLRIALGALVREKAWRPLEGWLFRSFVERYWMQIGVLRQYEPRPLRWDERLPGPKLADPMLPQIGIVTPSYGQERFIERTLRSVVDQRYPRLRYAVQDGGSKDRSPEIIARLADRLQHWESAPDTGQADAIARGFSHLTGMLESDDIMAWLNSDDLIGEGVLRFVGEYFARHPQTDVIYGHRIIIDDDDREIGRWIMPRHNPVTLEWIDYVPQETLFWRKRAWELVGGIDPSFQFALDWDLLARFQQAGCRVVRVPYFLGAFRVHAEQKTSQVIHTTGADEMRRIRTRFHGADRDHGDIIEQHARQTRFRGAVTARLNEIGIRW